MCGCTPGRSGTITSRETEPCSAPRSAPDHHVARSSSANTTAYPKANSWPFTMWTNTPTTRARSGSAATIEPSNNGTSSRVSPVSWAVTSTAVSAVVASSPNTAHPAQSTVAPSAARHGGQHGHLDALGHDGVHAVEIAGVVGTDEDVDVATERARFVAQSVPDGRMRDSERVDHRSDRGRLGNVQLDARNAARVRAQRRG